MSVTVILSRHNDTGPTASADVYNDAENIEITESGVLTIGCGWNDHRVVVGAYPPGGWLNAYVDADRTYADSEPPKVV
ncbi:hypothetical protein [Kineosporia succinea]|uniref:Uncharacterized protein n=1 Tax=Kineosporia succinea TaxID=84632 RepID=A0ABT9P2V7_9ACTN|nr:hypothetical protein [Kineosporia succinea]MDP9826906.1 hypothetical protein [Kineosporia succinea]